jgi:hypothetical protein
MSTPTIKSKTKADATQWDWPDLPSDLAALSGAWLVSAASAVVRGDEEAVASIRRTLAKRERGAALEGDYQEAVDALYDALTTLQAARDDVSEPRSTKAVLAAAKAVLAAEERVAVAQRARGFQGRAVAYLPPTMEGAASRPEAVHVSLVPDTEYPPRAGLVGALLCERLLHLAEIAAYDGRQMVLPQGLEVADLDRHAARARALRQDRDVILQRLGATGLTAAQRSHHKAHAKRVDEITRALLTGVEPEEWTEVPQIRNRIGGGSGWMDPSLAAASQEG